MLIFKCFHNFVFSNNHFIDKQEQAVYFPGTRELNLVIKSGAVLKQYRVHTYPKQSKTVIWMV